MTEVTENNVIRLIICCSTHLQARWTKRTSSTRISTTPLNKHTHTPYSSDSALSSTFTPESNPQHKSQGSISTVTKSSTQVSEGISECSSYLHSYRCSAACTERWAEVEYKSQYVVINHYPSQPVPLLLSFPLNSCVSRTRHDSGASQRSLRKKKIWEAHVKKNDAAKPVRTETLGRDKTCTTQRSKYCVAKSGIQIGVAFSERWANAHFCFTAKWCTQVMNVVLFEELR